MNLTPEMKQMRSEGMSYQKIADAVGASKSTVQESFGARKRGGKTVQTPSEGISLVNKNVYASLPQDRAKGLIYGLAKGRAYPVAELSEVWHMSDDTISKHARKHSALRYIETTPGQYIKCIMHPDTAAQYMG